MLRVRLFLSEAVRSIGANISTTVAAVMTVLIGMFLLGLFIALGSWVISWTNHVKKDLVVNVYFCTELTCGKEASDKQIEAVRTQLTGNPDVKEFAFITKEEALEEMKRRFPELTGNLARNPLPAAYEVVPADADFVQEIAATLEPAPAGVERVTYGEKKAERVLQVATIIGAIFLVGSVILLVASTILIANTIRLSIFSRRREIEVMKLVGATNWFVRAPFMLEGILCGLAGSVLAVVLLLLAKELALPGIMGRIESPDDIRAWSFPVVALVLVAVSLVVGAIGSGITMRRFLRI
ncbi:MAG TPA: permease-like cell division protein FtsX [Gaiellaceae bacterium]|nr:permease-like cell division protein FtsX [Gaiellaceae bacterium]